MTTDDAQPPEETPPPLVLRDMADAYDRAGGLDAYADAGDGLPDVPPPLHVPSHPDHLATVYTYPDDDAATDGPRVRFATLPAQRVTSKNVHIEWNGKRIGTVVPAPWWGSASLTVREVRLAGAGPDDWTLASAAVVGYDYAGRPASFVLLRAIP